MNPILIWITAACIFAPLSLAAPQLFPFSSLSSYFDQRARNGPGADKSAVIPQFIANAGNAVRASGGERFPRNHLPANHRPASLTDPPEQEAAETGFASVTAGLRGLGDAGGSGGGGGGGGGDRVQFQMHGLQGPHSYKFGYDTGKGKNRQFRYEERDNKGHVRGHYGFYNKHGKLQVVNYEAHPEHGFRADGNFGKHSAI